MTRFEELYRERIWLYQKEGYEEWLEADTAGICAEIAACEGVEGAPGAILAPGTTYGDMMRNRPSLRKELIVVSGFHHIVPVREYTGEGDNVIVRAAAIRATLMSFTVRTYSTGFEVRDDDVEPIKKYGLMLALRSCLPLEPQLPPEDMVVFTPVEGAQIHVLQPELN